MQEIAIVLMENMFGRIVAHATSAAIMDGSNDELLREVPVS